MRRGSVDSAITVEEACSRLEHGLQEGERKGAETLLVAFRNSSQPYRVCEHLLTRGASPGSQFQAASTLKEALLRDWPTLDPGFVGGLRDSLLLFVANRPQLAAFVRRQILHVVAVVFKRGFFRGADGTGEAMSAILVDQLTQLINSDLNKKLCGLDLILAVLEEFELTSTTSASLGLPLEFHEKCHHCLEGHTLPPVLRMVVGLLEGALGIPTPRPPEVSAVVEKCAKAVQIILGWRFDEAVSDYVLAIRASKMTEGELDVASNMASTPPASWTPLLVHSGLVESLFKAHTQIAPGSEPAESVRMALVSLASLQGSIFKDRDMQNKFGIRFCGLFLPIMVAATQGAANAEIVAWICHLLHCFIACYTVSAIIAFSEPDQFIMLVGQLTIGLLKAQATGADELRDAFVSILSFWVVLLEQGQRTRASDEVAATLMSHTETVFHAYLETTMCQARADEAVLNMLEEDCSSVAALGRRSLAQSLTLLTRGIRERALRLQSLASLSPPEVRGVQREAHVLLRLLAEIMSPVVRRPSDADCKAGFLECTATSSDLSDVSLPLEMTQLIRHEQWTSLLVDCFGAPREYATAEAGLMTAAKSMLETRTAHAVLWFLGGWVAQYLFPTSTTSLIRSSFPSHYPFASQSPRGADAVAFVIQKVWANLQLYASDTLPAAKAADTSSRAMLADRLCKRSLQVLLRLLESSKAACVSASTCQPWHQLMGTYQAVSFADTTNPGLLKPLFRAMVDVCTGSDQPKSSDMYRASIQPLEGLFSTVIATVKSGIRPLPATSRRSLHWATRMMRGIASTTGKPAYALVFELLGSCMVTFVEIWAVTPDLETEILRHFVRSLAATACTKLPFMSSTEVQGFVQVVLRTCAVAETQMRQHREHGMLETLLFLLNKMLSFEVTEQKSTNATITEAVLNALTTLVPSLISDPGNAVVLSRQLSLLQTLTRRNPRTFLQLHQPAFLGWLQLALHQPIPELVELALETIRNLAKFVHEQEATQSAVSDGLGPSMRVFLGTLFSLLLVGTLDPKLLEPIADTLLFVLAVNPCTVVVVEEFIREQVQGEAQRGRTMDVVRLKEQFGRLLETQDLPVRLPARRDPFRAKVRYFTRTTRAVLTSK